MKVFHTSGKDKKGGSAFHIRDLGSACGTFIRIPLGERKRLLPGKYSTTLKIIRFKV